MAVPCQDGIQQASQPRPGWAVGSSMLLCGFRFLRGHCKPLQQGWGGKPGTLLGELAGSRGAKSSSLWGPVCWERELIASSPCLSSTGGLAAEDYL